MAIERQELVDRLVNALIREVEKLTPEEHDIVGTLKLEIQCGSYIDVQAVPVGENQN